MKLYIYILMFILARYESVAEDEFEFKDLPQLRMIRIFGDNEREPPILVLKDRNSYSTNVGSEKITVEMDISADVPPSLYAKFVHCTADWRPTENSFYQELAIRRFSNINWTSATYSNSYYSHRATFTFPDIQISFKHSGNWEIQFFEYGNDTTLFASARFFVVSPIATGDLSIWNGMYEPKYPVASTCYNFEASVWSNVSLLDNNLHTCVLYKNNRWYEPLVITQNDNMEKFRYLYKYNYSSTVRGFVPARKFFRLENVPAENEYRVLDLTNIGYFPRSSASIRLPLSDLRRNGTFYDYDDDGIMVGAYVSSVYDDYVNVEFVMEPDGKFTDEDVFLIGSFNNWKPSSDWQMYFDEDERYYKLRQWVRRGKHNYLYATGRYHSEMDRLIAYSTDQYEGNTTLNSHTFIAFYYYFDVSLGGYDRIIAVVKQDISRRY